jgi:hypothetical protein
MHGSVVPSTPRQLGYLANLCGLAQTGPAKVSRVLAIISPITRGVGIGDVLALTVLLQIHQCNPSRYL